MGWQTKINSKVMKMFVDRFVRLGMQPSSQTQQEGCILMQSSEMYLV
jgi:hypothetical protein